MYFLAYLAKHETSTSFDSSYSCIPKLQRLLATKSVVFSRGARFLVFQATACKSRRRALRYGRLAAAFSALISTPTYTELRSPSEASILNSWPFGRVVRLSMRCAVWLVGGPSVTEKIVRKWVKK
jgi:hypothetical protein